MTTTKDDFQTPAEIACPPQSAQELDAAILARFFGYVWMWRKADGLDFGYERRLVAPSQIHAHRQDGWLEDYVGMPGSYTAGSNPSPSTDPAWMLEVMKRCSMTLTRDGEEWVAWGGGKSFRHEYAGFAVCMAALDCP